MVTTSDGATVIEVVRAPMNLAPLWLRVGVVATLLAGTLAALYFSGDEKIVLLILISAMICVTLIGGLLLVLSGGPTKSRRRTEVLLRAVWRDGTLDLRGGDIPGGSVEFPGREITDIRVDFHGGLDGSTPHMHLALCRQGQASMILLAGEDPGCLLWLGDALRRLAGLPGRQARMAAWLARKAEGLGPDPTQPRAVVPLQPAPLAMIAPHPDQPPVENPYLPASVAVVPVLAYATPGRSQPGRQGVEFVAGRMFYWLAGKEPYSAFISATVSQIQVVWHQEVVEFPSLGVYGAYVGAAAPGWLNLCTLDGIRDTLAGLPPETLREAARLLNELLGVEGNVYPQRHAQATAHT
jgi:hypothetical protein